MESFADGTISLHQFPPREIYPPPRSARGSSLRKLTRASVNITVIRVPLSQITRQSLDLSSKSQARYIIKHSRNTVRPCYGTVNNLIITVFSISSSLEILIGLASH